MKFTLLATLLISFGTQAAVINSAKLDANQENILVNVSYGGGCRKHNFTLDLNPSCLETYPVQCSANLVEVVKGGFDPCEAYITTTAVFNLKKLKLNDSYYSGASLTITGDIGASGEPTTATVILPR